MAKKKYVVSETAGPFVAGRRSPGAGKPLELTELEAFYPLLCGEITEPAGKSSKPVQTPVEETNQG